MPWITVLGSGSFGGKGFTYRGVNEVPEEHAQIAREEIAKHPGMAEWLIVTEVEPILVEPDNTGPLSIEDVRLGTPRAKVKIPGEPEPEPEPEEEDIPDEAPALDYECDHCDYRGPHPADIKRHFEFEHSLRHQKELEAMQAAAAEAEREERERRAVLDTPDSELPPHEREID